MAPARKKSTAGRRRKPTPVEEPVESEDDVVEDEDQDEDRAEASEDASDDEDVEEEAEGRAASKFEDSSSEEEDDDEDEDDAEGMSESESDSEEGNVGRRAAAAATSAFRSDLGHMTAFNDAPLDPSKLEKASTREAYLRTSAKENVDFLFRDLMQLQGVDGSQTIRELPVPTTKLPRHKPLPKPRPETRWEKFAKDKGITKRKRERMVWDEAKQAWAPRWGMGRVNDDQKDWLIELNDKEDPMADKFKERRDAKKLRVLKNRKKYLRNKAEAEGLSATHAVENLNVKGARSGASKRGKNKITKSLTTAQVSTASLGRFDRQLEGEPARQLKVSKKRKFQPSESTKDVDRDKKILDRLLGKHVGRSGAAPAPSASGKKQKFIRAKR